MIVHQLASRFKATSKSTGSGPSRHPVITRTRLTPVYSAGQFEDTVHRVGRMFVRFNGSKARISGNDGNTCRKMASVREGDVVGGTAPVIGVENRGRTML